MSLASLYIFFRFAHFMAVMLLFGISLFTALLSPKRLSLKVARELYPIQYVSTWFSALTALSMLAIQAGQLGSGWNDTIQLTLWWATLGTTFGQAWGWHLFFAWIMLLALYLPGLKRPQVFLLGSSLLLVSMAFTGHAVMHDGMLGMVHRVNHVLHLLAAGYWFGSLLPLLFYLRYLTQPQWRSDAIITLIDFSFWGHVAVILVVITGMINSLVILGHWPIEVGSFYQRLLMAKIALVILMVSVALTNRYVIVPAMRQQPKIAQFGLVTACWVEIFLGGAVLFLVSLFATYDPR